jgi:hypothetical protein
MSSDTANETSIMTKANNVGLWRQKQWLFLCITLISVTQNGVTELPKKRIPPTDPRQQVQLAALSLLTAYPLLIRRCAKSVAHPFLCSSGGPLERQHRIGTGHPIPASITAADTNHSAARVMVPRTSKFGSFILGFRFHASGVPLRLSDLAVRSVGSRRHQ